MPTYTVLNASEWFSYCDTIVNQERKWGTKAIRVELLCGHLLAIISL